jgi:hypothetical protein
MMSDKNLIEIEIGGLMKEIWYQNLFAEKTCIVWNLQGGFTQII